MGADTAMSALLARSKTGARSQRRFGDVLWLAALGLSGVFLIHVVRSTSRSQLKLTTSELERARQLGVWLGDPHARLLLVEFGDFQCPYCRAAYLNTERWLRHPGRALLYVNFPLTIHRYAAAAAWALACGKTLGVSPLVYDRLMGDDRWLISGSVATAVTSLPQITEAEWRTCAQNPVITQDVAQSIALGQEIGVNETPTFFLSEHEIFPAPDTAGLESATDSTSLARLIRWVF